MQDPTAHIDEHPTKDLWVTTTGLVVHSLAEGVAMGASLYSKFYLVNQTFYSDVQ